MHPFNDDDLICYCYNYSKKQIEKDYLENNTSTILNRIKSEKKNGRCDCAAKNPKGRWCVADVHQVVEDIKKAGDKNE